MKSEVKKKLKTSQSTRQNTVVPTVIIDPKKEQWFVFITLALYLIFGLIAVFHHEMWRDELQTWSLGAASSSFGEFLHNMKGESNPLLWYTFNFILSRFTDSPVSAQILHFLVSAGSVYLILKYAPFNRLQKVLLSFSYFIFFEYSIIARGYSLTVFFIFLFCTLYQIKSKNRYLILSLILVCLANTTGVHGVVITISLLGMMVVDYFYTEDTPIRKKYKPMQLFVAVLVALIGIYIALKWITPPATSDRSNTWFTSFDSQRFSESLRTFWMSFFPIENPANPNFWNSNIFFQKDTGAFTFFIFSVISIVIFIFCLLKYSQKISALFFFLAATCGVLLLCYLNNNIFPLLAARHYGFIFIAFVATIWLGGITKKSTFKLSSLNSIRAKFKIEQNFSYLMTGLFAINMLGSIIVFGKDYTSPFSEIKTIGDYINTNHLNKLPETGYIDYAVSPISAYTKQPIYFPDRDTTGRFSTWGSSRFSVDPNVVLKRLSNFISEQHDSVLFISTGDYFGIGAGKTIGKIQFSRLATFYDGNVLEENYILYLARYFDLNKRLNDSSSYKSPATLDAMMFAINDLIKSNKLDEAQKDLLTIEQKTNPIAVPHLHNYLGTIYAKKNMQPEAAKEFNTEISLNLQKDEAYFDLGMLYFQNNDFKNAIHNWDSAVSINPKNADAYNYLGICYKNALKDNSKGMGYFEKTVELSPDYIDGYFNILACAQSLNDEQTLIKYIRILVNKGTTIDAIKAKGITISDALLQKINSH